ncbi:MAG TPA: hypothetical protein VMT34_11070 [Aggregatilineales bacterium]|nr:hypothetical protein [Aggregatilineales bacterium]
MQLLIFRALWGMTGSFEEQIERIAAAGYDGVDGFVGPHTPPPAKFSARVASHGLKLIMAAQVERRDQIEPTLKALAEYEPLKIGLHSGRDAMSREEGCSFLEEALRVESAACIPVAHETHRGRLFFSPWDSAFYLRQFDKLKLLADYSHWVNVCERLPDDQAEALALANQRVIHIHGRVGYEQGPQVPDPAAPEYARQRAWHEDQWRKILQIRQQAGDSTMTFTPEYGPPDYLHTLPYTHVPVADLWDICLQAGQRARQVLGSAATT